MIGNYIFGSHAVLLVYDITNYQACAARLLSYQLVPPRCAPSGSRIAQFAQPVQLASRTGQKDEKPPLRSQSFQNLEDWFALVKQTFKDKPMPLIVRTKRRLGPSASQPANCVLLSVFVTSDSRRPERWRHPLPGAHRKQGGHDPPPGREAGAAQQLGEGARHVQVRARSSRCTLSPRRDCFDAAARASPAPPLPAPASTRPFSLRSYFVSAKTGDNVHSTFFRIAADLAGVVRPTSSQPLPPFVCPLPAVSSRSRGRGPPRTARE